MSKPLTEDALDARLTGAVREIVGHFNKSQGTQNERLDTVDATQKEHTHLLTQIDTKVTAIMEQLALRQELQNLVRELKNHGIPVDPNKVFVAPETGIQSSRA